MPYGETDWSTFIEQAPSKDLHAPPSAPPSRLLTTASSPSASPSPFLPSEQPSCVPAMVNMSADKPVHDTSEARQRVLENLGLDEEGEKKDRRVPDGEMRSVGLGMNMPPDDEHHHFHLPSRSPTPPHLPPSSLGDRDPSRCDRVMGRMEELLGHVTHNRGRQLNGKAKAEGGGVALRKDRGGRFAVE